MQDVAPILLRGQSSRVKVPIDDGVLEVMHRIGHVIGEVHDLGFNGEPAMRKSLPSPLKDILIIGIHAKLCPTTGVNFGSLGAPGVLNAREQARSGQVQPARNTGGVNRFGLEPHEQAKGLRVSLKTTTLRCPLRQRFFTVVTKGGMTQVMGERSEE